MRDEQWWVMAGSCASVLSIANDLFLDRDPLQASSLGSNKHVWFGDRRWHNASMVRSANCENWEHCLFNGLFYPSWKKKWFYTLLVFDTNKVSSLRSSSGSLQTHWHLYCRDNPLTIFTPRVDMTAGVHLWRGRVPTAVWGNIDS